MSTTDPRDPIVQIILTIRAEALAVAETAEPWNTESVTFSKLLTIIDGHVAQHEFIAWIRDHVHETSTTLAAWGLDSIPLASFQSFLDSLLP